MQINSMLDLSEIKITESNKLEFLKCIFEYPFEEITALEKLDIQGVVASLSGHDIVISNSFDALQSSFQAMNISEQAFERFLCDVLVHSLLFITERRSTNVELVNCDAPYTLSIPFNIADWTIAVYGVHQNGVRLKPFKWYSDKQLRETSLGEYNVSLVAKYIQAVLIKAFSVDKIVKSELEHFVPVFNRYLGVNKPCPFIRNLHLPSPATDVETMIIKVNRTIESAYDLNSSYTKARFDLLQGDLNIAQVDTKLSDKHYSLLDSHLKKYFSKASSSSPTAINMLLALFVGVALTVSCYHDFIAHDLEV